MSSEEPNHNFGADEKGIPSSRNSGSDDALEEVAKSGSLMITCSGVTGNSTGEMEVEQTITNDDGASKAVEIKSGLQHVIPTSAKEFNQEIREHISKMCPAEDVAKFRLVSTDWNEAALKAWRNVSTLVLVDFEEKKPRKLEFHKFMQLRDLIKYMEDPDFERLKLNPEKDYRFRKYKLERWYLTDKSPNMVKFWGNLGSYITHLELSNLRVEKMCIILQVLFERVPNMHTLILDKLFVQKSRSGVDNAEEREVLDSISPQRKLKVLKVANLSHFPVDWVAFLKHFPSIEVLESFNVKSDDDLGLILRAIGTIRLSSLQTVLPLKSLSICRGNTNHLCVRRKFPNDLIRILENNDFEMEELSLKFGCRTTPTTASTTLGIFARSLKKLTFHIDYKCKNSAYRFPYLLKFPQLVQLELWQWCVPETQLHVLFRSMPNLKVLKVKGFKNLFGLEDAYYRKILAKGEKMNVCESLVELSFTAFKLSPAKFDYLTLMAPNLAKLELKLDDTIFRAICKKYSNLTELRVSGNGLTDEGVTGFLKDSKKFRKGTNISNLKNLRVFILHDRRHRLTNKSIFHGFLEVKSLLTLEMALPPDQINNDARLALEKSIQNLVILPGFKNKLDSSISLQIRKRKFSETASVENEEKLVDDQENLIDEMEIDDDLAQ